ncbi:uncharacterized protein F5Z01DRAFT_666467 [Emericellopsis atlantica]|uniref:Uncharacterized protein n=1 Tax=Emericellopsis atlantica TaxID=2614577 RepID=A0A9P8CM55_9HYPO|nr:uncharacterized protein F5Z01DRAFT_666467 [Emericellopsis atlantica]KAG9250321.1 hypothetical protein F5Z01DRAFT_666467 [Emericellopsis atlantica]
METTTDSASFPLDVEGQQSWGSGHSGIRESLSRRWRALCVRSSAPQRTKKIQLSILQISTHQKKAVTQIFGVPVQALSEWPGLSVFSAHLEDQLKELLNDRFTVISKILNQSNSMTLIDLWHWVSLVLDSFDSLQVHDTDTSIERTFQEMVRRAGIPAGDVLMQDKKQIIIAMFAVLCWCSAAIRPILDDNGYMRADTDASPVTTTAQSICLTAENSSQLYSTRDLRRPLSKMFLSFRGRNMGRDQGEPNNGDTPTRPMPGFHSDSDVLHKSSLNYFSLYTIGKVRLKWVDTLTEHLAFDHSTRTLSLYRYPSHCAINILRQDDPKVLKNIVARLFYSGYCQGLSDQPAALYREILLSYRILFGRCSKSRTLLLQALALQDTHATAVDPFLLTVCTQSPSPRWPWQRPGSGFPSCLFPASAIDVNGQLQELNTYSARDHFPIFGHMLLSLQRYNLRQQPSRLRDLWRDQRNPLQWYTFWAVIWVGGASLLLSFLQLSVGAAQLYYAIKSP